MKCYSEALACYSEAIRLAPNTASYYGNRCACYVMLGNYMSALEDAKKSILLDPVFMKGYVRMVKCYIALGDLKSAENTIVKAKEIDSQFDGILSEEKNLKTILQFKNEADVAYEKKDFRKVVYCVDRILGQGCRNSTFKLYKAECLTLLGRYQEAQEIANDVIRADAQNVDAIYVRGMCLYYEDDIERAFSHFQYALKLAPDHKKVLAIYKKAKMLKQKKEEGNEAFKNCQYQAAYNLYAEALTIDPKNKSTNAKLYFNRATVSSKVIIVYVTTHSQIKTVLLMLLFVWFAAGKTE
jgi:DnaJ family protein C protein 7